MGVTDRWVRALALVAGVVVLGGVLLWIAAGSRPRTPEERQQAAHELLSGVHVQAAVASASFVAAAAVADLGGQNGAHVVRVRILDDVQLEVHLAADRSVVFNDAPRLCLVGPFSAPDDAGLTDPCWGEPDLGALVTAQLERDAVGHPSLGAGRSVDLTAALRRGSARCDYPPGTWQLEVVVDPVIDGSAVGPVPLPDLTLDMPFVATDVLPLLRPDESRYCGLASVVFREQGEPPVQSP
jgi:hypothetical protein